ncbi:DUF6588 family protein [Marinilabilia rubra]|uniref:Outer membrane protein beta-barrel domain-containing protein n=1 Tax=Marinilabilia rubra TaxID=2162893 RepID=A0A2U2B4B4_9BACT|nr:DUF6588 family protein [Marinilabilia rubra]PWD97898.1 hypothetical protein DDZ16_18240 [Marinilabilia rubra]
MKLMKRSFSVLLACFISLSAFSQEPLRNFFQAGEDNARILTKAYLKPYGEMLGTSLNAGWYNTAKVHKLGGFDLTFSVMNAVAPSSATTFDVSELNLNGLTVEGTSAPTIAGDMPEADRAVLSPSAAGGDMAEFTMPNGAGNDKLPIPMLQAAVGLPFNTEVMARFVPTMDFGDAGEVSAIGFGLKHSLKDYIPFVKRLPFLQMSVLAAYTDFNSSYGVGSGGMMEVENGALDISSGAFTTRLLVGANFPVVAIYTGVGYGSTNSDFDVKGTYTYTNDSSQEISIGPDPFTLGYKTTGIDFNAGLRLRLGFLALHADYTVGDYSVLTAGVGINIR